MIRIQQQLARINLARRLLAVAASAIILCSGSTASFAQSDGSWRVSDLKGSARLYQDGAGWTDLKRGDIVRAGGRVTTGDSSRIILVRPGDSIDVAPNSRFEIAPDPTITNNPASRIRQSVGTLLFKITTRSDRPFKVDTKYLAAVIKGTTFTVSATPSDSALHVSKGAVEVRSILTNQMVMVRPGQTAAINGSRGGQMRLIGYRKSQSNQGNRTNHAASQALKFSKATTGTSEAGRGALKYFGPSAATTGPGRGAFKIKRMVGADRIDIGRLSNGLVKRGPGSRVAEEGGIKDDGDRKTKTGSPTKKTQPTRVAVRTDGGPSLGDAADGTLSEGGVTGGSSTGGNLTGGNLTGSSPTGSSPTGSGNVTGGGFTSGGNSVSTGITTVNTGIASITKDIGKAGGPVSNGAPKLRKSIEIRN